MGQVEYVEVFDARGRLLGRHRIDAWPVTVGRGLANAVIVDDPFVCPAHLRVAPDGNGGLALEDLGSVNGTYAEPAGERVTRTHLAPGASIRIGATVLRFVGREHPVAPTLPYRHAHDGAPWFTRRPVSALAWLAIPLTLGLGSLLDTYEWPRAQRVIGTDLVVTVMVAAWAAGWALANRIVTHQWRFAAHAAVGCAFFVVDALPDLLRDYARFLFGDGWSATVLWAALMTAPLAWLLAAHLAVVGVMPRHRRRVVAVAGALLVVGLVSAMSGWSRLDFSNDIHFESTLRPLPRAWIPTSPVAALASDVDALEAEVRGLAAGR